MPIPRFWSSASAFVGLGGLGTLRIIWRPAGYAFLMLNPRLEDRAMGLELQIEELVERQKRANQQRFYAEAARLQTEIGSLQAELVATAESIASEVATPTVL